MKVSKKMFKKIKKWLVKKFIPTADDLSDKIAMQLADFINSQDESIQSKIIKYDEYANTVTKALTIVTNCLKDGKIDLQETTEISDYIKPLVEKVLEIVKEKI